MFEFSLTGPRGDNPLGFLAALGALVALEDAGHRSLLGWDGVVPKLLVDLDDVVEQKCATEQQRRAWLVGALHHALSRRPNPAAAETKRTREEMKRAKRALNKKQKEIKKTGLRGSEAQQARGRELEPLRRQLDEKPAAYQRALAASAADPTVTLGKNLTERNAKLIAHLHTACQSCVDTGRRWVDLAAAYGVADPAQPDSRMLASPWALIKGYSHQDFLGSVEELMIRCTAAHFHQVLFEPWQASDRMYSLRLDPAEDRRYALMHGDPTGRGNEPLTLWGANRLAFEAFRFFPAMPARAGMAVRGWRAPEGNWQEGCRVRWPLWARPAVAGVVHSLLGLRELWVDEAPARERLRAMGIHAVFESGRIAAARKFSLTPATPVWVST